MINLQNSVDENGVADARHILIDDIWPDNYEDPELITAVEKIMIEWNKLNGQDISFNEIYYKKDMILYERAKLHCLDCAYRMIGVSDVWEFKSIVLAGKGLKEESEFLLKESKEMYDSAIELLIKYNFRNLKTTKDIEQKSKQIEQKLINDIDDARKDNKKHNLIFEDFIIPISIIFKMNPSDLYDITCSMYISFINRMKKMNELSNKNG